MNGPEEQIPYKQAPLVGCITVTAVLLLMCLLPLLFLEFAQQALQNLHLTRMGALLVLLGSLLGSGINIPVARFPLDEEVVVPTFDIAGWNVIPRYQRLRKESVVAINVGGCIVPVLLAAWLLRFILPAGHPVVTVMLAGLAINTAICYWLARPVPRLGIVLPGFLPAAVALGITWLGLGGRGLGPYHAPVAYVIGISGPLLGADLLHWKDFKSIAAGTISIGGAGTWDGIVLSGLLAAFLAGAANG